MTSPLESGSGQGEEPETVPLEQVGLGGEIAVPEGAEVARPRQLAASTVQMRVKRNAPAHAERTPS